jgi:hypothetical protein
MRRWFIFLWSGFWLYLCLMPSLEQSTASYARWAHYGCPGRNGLPGCAEWEGLRDLGLWILTMPLLVWALSRYPRIWPAFYTRKFWDASRPMLSLSTALILAALLLSGAWGALHARMEAVYWTQGLALLPLLLLGLWYRAALLSAPANAS